MDLRVLRTLLALWALLSTPFFLSPLPLLPLLRVLPRPQLDVEPRCRVVRQPQLPRDPVQAVAHRHVERLAEDAVAAARVGHDLRVAARRVQHHRVREPRREAAHLDVRDAVVHRHERDAAQQRERLREDGDGGERPAHAGALGVGDSGYLGNVQTGLPQRALGQGDDLGAMVLGHLLGEEALARRRVVRLAYVAVDAAGLIRDAYAELVRGALQTEDVHHMEWSPKLVEEADVDELEARASGEVQVRAARQDLLRPVMHRVIVPKLLGSIVLCAGMVRMYLALLVRPTYNKHAELRMSYILLLHKALVPCFRTSCTSWCAVSTKEYQVNVMKKLREHTAASTLCTFCVHVVIHVKTFTTIDNTLSTVTEGPSSIRRLSNAQITNKKCIYNFYRYIVVLVSPEKLQLFFIKRTDFEKIYTVPLFCCTSIPFLYH